MIWAQIALLAVSLHIGYRQARTTMAQRYRSTLYSRLIQSGYFKAPSSTVCD